MWSRLLTRILYCSTVQYSPQVNKAFITIIQIHNSTVVFLLDPSDPLSREDRDDSSADFKARLRGRRRLSTLTKGEMEHFPKLRPRKPAGKLEKKLCQETVHCLILKALLVSTTVKSGGAQRQWLNIMFKPKPGRDIGNHFLGSSCWNPKSAWWRSQFDWSLQSLLIWALVTSAEQAFKVKDRQVGKKEKIFELQELFEVPYRVMQKQTSAQGIKWNEINIHCFKLASNCVLSGESMKETGKRVLDDVYTTSEANLMLTVY